MKLFIHIIKYKLLIFLRLNEKLSPVNVLKNIGSGVIYAGFAAGAFIFTQKLIAFLLKDLKLGLFLLHEFMAMILFIFFVAVNIGNIIVSYSTLYKSQEVSFLLTKPVNPSTVFAVKFLDNFFYSSATLMLVLTAVIAGYAIYFGIGVLAVMNLLFFNFLPFMLSAGALGIIILLLLIKSASVFGVKKVVYGLTALYASAVLLFFNVNSPVRLVRSVMQYYPFIDKDEYLSRLIPPVIKFLPNSWLSESAYWIVKSDFAHSLQLQAYQLLLTAALILVALYLGKKWFLETWLLNQKLNAEFTGRRRIKAAWFSSGSSIMSPQSESIIKKDMLVFLREPNQIIHFAILSFLIFIFIGSVSGIKFMRLGNYYLHTLIYLSVLLFNLLFISTLGLRFVFPIISLEGMTFWKIKSAPVSPFKYFGSKVSFYLVFIVLTGQVLNYFSSRNFPGNLMLIGSVVVFWASVTIFFINYGLGNLYANYREKNAIRLASSQGATLAFLITVVYMIFLIVILFTPLSEYFLSLMINKNFDISGIYKLFGPFILISAIIISVFVKLGYDSLNKDF